MILKKFNQILFFSEIIRLRKSILRSAFRFKKIKNLISLQVFRLCRLTKPLPYAIVIDPTSACNLKCPMCPKIQNKTNIPEGFMDFNKFKKLIDEIKYHALLIVLCYNGEPLLHNRIADMIKYTHENNILTYISTSLSFKDDKKVKELAHSGLDFITVALDGAKKETYEKYRKGGDFDQVIKNIRLLTKEKEKTLLVELQFIVMKENENEIENIQRLAKELKVNRLVLKSVHVENDTKKFLPSNNTYRLQFKSNTKCLYPFARPVIAWNGLIFPCCSNKISLNKEYNFGNVFEKGFKNTWFIKEYENFRKIVSKESNKLRVCKKCFTNNIIKNRVILRLD